MKATFRVATSLLGAGQFPLNGSACRGLRPVRVARIISQVEDVAGDVVLRGEIRQDPGLFGGSYLQAAHWTVSALPAPARTEEGGSRHGEE